MARFPWLKRKRSAPELPEEPPIWLGNHSNGEYFHFQTPYERKLRKLILETADANARKLGMERREFLHTAMGMATTLWCINYATGCSSSDADTGKTAQPSKCGGYNVYKEAMLDESACTTFTNKGEFIFDIQTHHFDPEGNWTTTNPAYAAFLGGGAGGFTRYDRDHYTDAMFCQSDTTMTVLTAWPAALCTAQRKLACGLPLSNEQMQVSRDAINASAANSQRVVSHCQIMPNDPAGVDNQLKIMEEMACEHGIRGWKLYPAWGPDGVGYYLDDPIGIKVIEKGMELGVKVFCIHKGLPIPGFDVTHNFPREIGRLAKKYPDAKFVIYHSAICAGSSSFCLGAGEAAYDPNHDAGVDTLIKACQDSGIEPGSNVYGELGSCWSQVMGNPTTATHVLGKLMKYLGPDNVCWGTDVLASPAPAQSQITALRGFTIPADNPDGYPALDDAQRAKIFGLNAAKVFGIDAEAKRCEISRCTTAMLKQQIDEDLGPFHYTFESPKGITTWREYVEHAQRAKAAKVPA